MKNNPSTSQLSLHCWEGYEEPEFIADFFDESGVQLTTRNLISDHAAACEILDDMPPADVININNAYPKKVLHPAGRLVELDPELLISGSYPGIPWIRHLEQWGLSDSGRTIGICQRFGSFNLVVNTNRLSMETATDVGFKLVHETGSVMDYGILLFPEFNIFHVCIAAGLNPFQSLSKDQLELFEQTADLWFANASLVTDDSRALNQSLINGDISYFLSGGVFTSGATRLAGHTEIVCITPASGPIDGKGAISFMEITSLINNGQDTSSGYAFLNYLLRPDTARQVAINSSVCNPVAQMTDPEVFGKMSRAFLRAIQWDTLEEDIGRCAVYDIPPDFTELRSRLNRVMRRYDHLSS